MSLAGKDADPATVTVKTTMRTCIPLPGESFVDRESATTRDP